MIKNKKNRRFYSTWELTALTFLRILIGWHFLYEGLVKIFSPAWTAKGYLLDSVGPSASLFKNIAMSESLMIVVDLLNEWGLILIGLSLFLGFLSKPAKIFGILLLFLYYLAYPPFPGTGVEQYVQGNYWIVNDQLIEIGALLVLLVFPTNYVTGIDRFIFNSRKTSINNSTIL